LIDLLFFGQIAKMWALKGKITPSTALRCIRISKELEKLGFSSRVRYCTVSDFESNLSAVRSSDVVVFHRIQFPMAGRPEPATEVFLHLASKAMKKITVFDIDDSIFLHYPMLTEFFVKSSDLVTVGSHQLEAYARRWNSHVKLVPTGVDTEVFSPGIRRPNRNSCILGWHGTAYVQEKNLRMLLPALRILARKYDLTFKLLGSMGNRRLQNIFESVKGLTVDFGPDSWIPYQELPSHLASVDIGLSPLRDDLWSRGKCAMKALEYMSMSKPVVVSPTGEHNYIIRNGVNGLFAETTENWVSAISSLIENKGVRHELGVQGRQTVLKAYSMKVVAKKLAGIIERLVNGERFARIR
jgi:glycosyltransferase involved in cell wall biosynthesis